MTARARHTDPSTSHAAADSVKDLSKSQAAVLRVLRLNGRPMLDEELIRLYQRRQKAYGKLPKQSESGIRSRRSELAKAGLVVKDERKKMSTGRMGNTWTPAP